MILDLATIQASIKDQLADPNEKGDLKRINRAINNCLDDLSNRLDSAGLMASHSETVAANTRSLTVSGEADDLKYLFALKYGTGDEQKVLDYIDKEKFLRKYDNPSADAGVPVYFSILTNDAGNPVIKFNCPTLVQDTLVIYYTLDYSSNNLANLRSGSAIIAGALAWFWGIADGKEDVNGNFVPGRGQRSYAIYEELVKGMRSSDHFLSKPKKKFGISAFDEGVRSAINSFTNNRP